MEKIGTVFYSEWDNGYHREHGGGSDRWKQVANAIIVGEIIKLHTQENRKPLLLKDRALDVLVSQ